MDACEELPLLEEAVKRMPSDAEPLQEVGFENNEPCALSIRNSFNSCYSSDSEKGFGVEIKNGGDAVEASECFAMDRDSESIEIMKRKSGNDNRSEHEKVEISVSGYNEGCMLMKVDELSDDSLSSIRESSPEYFVEYDALTGNSVAAENLDAIGEEGDATDYDVEMVIAKQTTHDLFCPNCHSCITRRVILRRRKHKIRYKNRKSQQLKREFDEALKTNSVVDQDSSAIRSSDNVASHSPDLERKVDLFRCLSCFRFFIPSGTGFKLFQDSEGREEKKNAQVAQQESSENTSWISSIFATDRTKSRKKENENKVDSGNVRERSSANFSASLGDQLVKNDSSMATSLTSSLATDREIPYNDGVTDGSTGILSNSGRTALIDGDTNQEMKCEVSDEIRDSPGLHTILTNKIEEGTVSKLSKVLKIEEDDNEQDTANWFYSIFAKQNALSRRTDESDAESIQSFSSFADHQGENDSSSASNPPFSMPLGTNSRDEVSIINDATRALSISFDNKSVDSSGLRVSSATVTSKNEKDANGLKSIQSSSTLTVGDDSSTTSNTLSNSTPSFIDAREGISKIEDSIRKFSTSKQRVSSAASGASKERPTALTDGGRKPIIETALEGTFPVQSSVSAANAATGRQLAEVNARQIDFNFIQESENGAPSPKSYDSSPRLIENLVAPKSLISSSQKSVNNSSRSFKAIGTIGKAVNALQSSTSKTPIIFSAAEIRPSAEVKAADGNSVSLKINETRSYDYTSKTGDSAIKISPEEAQRESRNSANQVDIMVQSAPATSRAYVETITGGCLVSCIVYGGLAEAVTSVGVVSSAAGANATTASTVGLGLANLLGGFFILWHSLWDLKNDHSEEDPERGSNNSRYGVLHALRENFALHAAVVIASYAVFGALPPLIYGFSFYKSNNSDFKILVVGITSLICISLLAAGKTYVSRKKAYMKNIAYFVAMAFAASGCSFVVGHVFEKLAQKIGWPQANGYTPLPLLQDRSLQPPWPSY